MKKVNSSIIELRNKCQSVGGPWYAQKIVRKISIYFTWLLLHTPISANGATVLQLIVSLIGAFLIASGSLPMALLGIFLIQIGYILDCTDGEIARYYNKSTKKGIYIDIYNHIVVICAMFFSIGIMLMNHYSWYILSGVLFSNTLLSLSSIKLSQQEYLIVVGSTKSNAQRYQNALKTENAIKEKTNTNQKKLAFPFSQIRYLFIYPGTMNIFTIAIALSLILNNLLILLSIYILYSIAFLLRDLILFLTILKESDNTFVSRMKKFKEVGKNN